MVLNWIEAILYGFLSGLAEFMPVSAQAHQQILIRLFGCDESSSLMNLFVHMGALFAILLSSGGYLNKLSKEYSLSKSHRRRRKREVDMQAVFDVNFVKTACIPLLIGFVLYAKTMGWGNNLPLISVFLILNGIILFIPSYLATGNKDSRNMSALDAILFGLASALSALPGVSRVAGGHTLAVARGADPHEAFKWSLLLSIPALAVLMCFDLYTIFAIGSGATGSFFLLKCLIGFAFSYIGATISIAFMKSLTLRSGLSVFSYYSWGAALFTFIIYLF